jgi:hypothetical protein
METQPRQPSWRSKLRIALSTWANEISAAI